jgi:hypothetical protein
MLARLRAREALVAAATRGGARCWAPALQRAASAAAPAGPPPAAGAADARGGAGAAQEGPGLLRRAVGVGLGATTGVMLAGTLNFLLEFPEPCEMVYHEAQTNAKALAAFGDNMRRDLFWEGVVASEQASVTLGVRGDKASGTVYGRLVRSVQTGEWEPVLIVARCGESLISLKEKRIA